MALDESSICVMAQLRRKDKTQGDTDAVTNNDQWLIICVHEGKIYWDKKGLHGNKQKWWCAGERAREEYFLS